ncbi:DNA cytosine methyltransferase [Chloroflexota bacterium]
MKFVDLFAGLGGFHLALRRLGHACVFACEIDETLRTLYEKNFGMQCAGDIRKIGEIDVPSHDILCAGFPCQPFSKAGDQEGFDDPDFGGLFYDILRIVNHHQPQYILLENVPNFFRHDGGQTWSKMQDLLCKAGYLTESVRLSPHQFGIPQIRDRIYIVASRTPLDHFSKLVPVTHTNDLSIISVLDKNPTEAKSIPDQVKICLDVWQEFLDQFPEEEKLPSFPIWSMEFGASYPYENTTPSNLSARELRKYRGSHGCILTSSNKSELLQMLPSHARTSDKKFPKWKVDFIRQNRDLYNRHKAWIDKWKPKITGFPSSFQKLEWNCQGEPRTLRNFIIQVRASGVRIKRPTTAPSLVAMTATQVPIIAWEDRYMTPTECKRLQSMDELVHLPEKSTKTYEALGNAINVDICVFVVSRLIDSSSMIYPNTIVQNPPSTSLISRDCMEENNKENTYVTGLVD